MQTDVATNSRIFNISSLSDRLGFIREQADPVFHLQLNSKVTHWIVALIPNVVYRNEKITISGSQPLGWQFTLLWNMWSGEEVESDSSVSEQNVDG